MGIKKFIEKAIRTLGLDNCEVEGKKHKLKALLKKLSEKKITIRKSLEASLEKKERKELEEGTSDSFTADQKREKDST